MDSSIGSVPSLDFDPEYNEHFGMIFIHQPVNNVLPDPPNNAGASESTLPVSSPPPPTVSAPPCRKIDKRLDPAIVAAKTGLLGFIKPVDHETYVGATPKESPKTIVTLSKIKES